MTEINIEQLTKELQNLKRHQELYRVVKRELLALGYWKNKKRGDPAKGYREKGCKNA